MKKIEMLRSRCCYFFLVVVFPVIVHASQFLPKTTNTFVSRRNNRSSSCGIRHHEEMTIHNSPFSTESNTKSNYVEDNNRSNNILMRVRGGASLTDEDDDIQISTTKTADNIILTKVRNVVRSLLGMSDQKTPYLSSALRKVVNTMESILGVKLTVDPSKKKKKKKKTKKTSSTKTKKKRESIDSDEEESSSKEETESSSKKSTSTKISAAASQHLEKTLKSTNPNYRIQRELRNFLSDPPPHLKVKVGKNMRVWIVKMEGAPNTIYEGETFKLRIKFPNEYPTVPPSVYFLKPNIPTHEHVYTNGDICLSLLGKGWKPSMTAQSIAVSILSILSSAKTKSLPMDNARHAHNKPGEYQKDWVYHDDIC